MRRRLLLLLFCALCSDFAMVDTPVFLAGARAAQWDDEEESVPSRRQPSHEDERVKHSPLLPQRLEPAPPRRPEAGQYADRRARPAAANQALLGRFGRSGVACRRSLGLAPRRIPDRRRGWRRQISSAVHQGANEMAKTVDVIMILVVMWLVLHRVVLRWFKHYLGVQ
jgi:hypothetical protein